MKSLRNLTLKILIFQGGKKKHWGPPVWGKRDGKSRVSSDGDDKPSKSFGKKKFGKPKPSGKSSNRKSSFRGGKFDNDTEVTKPSKATFRYKDDDEIRLNKFLANAGVCSRREADELIKIGTVSVNGKIVTELGRKVKLTDTVKYNGETLKGEKLVYLLLNKPKDYITTMDDPKGRKTVLTLMGSACKERIYPVGRLDRNTTGVLLFTNDGDLAKKLTHPKHGVSKIYQAELDRPVKSSEINMLAEGVELEDGMIHADKISYVGDKRNTVGLEIHSGRNRIVRRMFEHFGYKVKKLDRVMFANLTKKDLPRGNWRFLTEEEIGFLKMIK